VIIDPSISTLPVSLPWTQETLLLQLETEGFNGILGASLIAKEENSNI